MQDYSSIKQPPIQGVFSYQPAPQRTDVAFSTHALERIQQRGGDRHEIAALVTSARSRIANQIEIALLAGDWVIIANYQRRRPVVKTILEPGMALKPGTPVVWA